MAYSIRIGFLLALLSVFLWAGLSHPKTEKLHKNFSSNSSANSSGIIFLAYPMAANPINQN